MACHLYKVVNIKEFTRRPMLTFAVLLTLLAALSPAESATAFSLEIKMKGAVAFVPINEGGTEKGAFAIVVNATRNGINNDKLLKSHIAAIRVRARNLFTAGIFRSEKAIVIIPLEGDEISVSSNCGTPGTFKFDPASRKKVAKISQFAPDFAGVPATFTKQAKDIPKSRVLARYRIDRGTLVFNEPITDSNGADIRWCFGTQAPPANFACESAKVQEPIAQAASVEFDCSGASFILTLDRYDGNSKRESTIFPDSDGKVKVEIVNEMPEDVALPDIPSQVPDVRIDHFRWFYVLSETVPPSLDKELFPFIGQDPEKDGKPFCSVVEMK